MATAVVSDASRFVARGAPDCAVCKISTAAQGHVVRRTEDFAWLSHQLSLRFPGCVTPPIPGAEGPLPSVSRSEEARAYLRRFWASAARYVERISARADYVTADCVVAFLYASGAAFEAAKPRLDDDARKESLVSDYWKKPGLGGSDPRVVRSIKQLLGPQAKAAEDAARTTVLRTPKIDSAQIDYTLAKMGRQPLEESLETLTLDAAASRERARETKEADLAKKCATVQAAVSRRDDSSRTVGSALRQLARFELDPEAAQPIAKLGAVLTRKMQTHEPAQLRTKPEFDLVTDAVTDARLMTKCAVEALRDRAVVASALGGDVRIVLGDVKARAAKERTKHMRLEASLAQVREARGRALAASADVAGAAPAKRMSTAPMIIVDAAPPSAANTSAPTTRAVMISPLAAAMAADSVPRIPEPKSCDGGRVAEKLTCGFVQPQTPAARVRRRNDAEQALSEAETRTGEARAAAGAADEAERHIVTALRESTRRLAAELGANDKHRAAVLKGGLLSAATAILHEARADRAALETLRDQLLVDDLFAPPTPSNRPLYSDKFASHDNNTANQTNNPFVVY